MGDERAALLIDGDNISARHAPRIRAAAARLGRLDIARVYGTTNGLSCWQDAPGLRLIHAGAAKNAADILLAMDAMELAHAGGFTRFAIVSSDGDFSHVALRLREMGTMVLGLGEDKAPEGFRLACTRFDLVEASKEGRVATVSQIDLNIRTIIAAHSKAGQGMRVSDLGQKIQRTHGIRINTLPEGNWRSYLAARPELYDLDPRGPEAMVRYLPAGFAA